jgi:hypothetical protein
MSAAAAARSTRPRWWPACDRRPDTPSRPEIVQTLAWPPTPAWPPVPDTSRPDGGRSRSSGRSIRRSLPLVTTSSTPPQGRPCGRRLRRPSWRRHDGHRGAGLTVRALSANPHRKHGGSAHAKRMRRLGCGDAPESVLCSLAGRVVNRSACSSAIPSARAGPPSWVASAPRRLFSCHRPPGQAEDPLGDPGRARIRRFPPNRILAASTGLGWLVGPVVGLGWLVGPVVGA